MLFLNQACELCDVRSKEQGRKNHLRCSIGRMIDSPDTKRSQFQHYLGERDTRNHFSQSTMTPLCSDLSHKQQTYVQDRYIDKRNIGCHTLLFQPLAAGYLLQFRSNLTGKVTVSLSILVWRSLATKQIVITDIHIRRYAIISKLLSFARAIERRPPEMSTIACRHYYSILTRKLERW